METTSPWPIALKYALVLAFSYIAINIVFYIVSPDSMDGTMSVSGFIQLAITVIVGIYVLFIAAKARRDHDLGGEMSYGKSLGFMMQTALPAAIIVSFYSYIFFTFISPESLVKIIDSQGEQLAKQGKSDEEIEQMLGYTRMFTTPLWMTVFGTFGTMLQLFIFALIASIFAKKEPKTFE